MFEKTRDNRTPIDRHSSYTMSATTEVFKRHRKLTRDLRFRVSEAMYAELQKTAERMGMTASDAAREAFGEFIENHKSPKRSR